VLAFWTDTTRNITFMFANDVSPRNFSFLEGVKENHHSSSHHGKDQVKLDSYKIITRWHVEQFVYLLTRLKSIKEGERTLLDNSMIMCGSACPTATATTQTISRSCWAAKAGGYIASGRHLAYTRDTPLCNLYVSMLSCMGVQVPRFGDSTGRLKGLLI